MVTITQLTYNSPEVQINYPGFVQNGRYKSKGDETVAQPGCTIRNLTVDGTNGSLSNNGGWICQEYFGYGNLGGSTLTVENCNSSGTIDGQYAGGIFGGNANGLSEGGAITVENCYSSGLIEGDNAGGIFGYQANTGSEGGAITIHKQLFKWKDSGKICRRYFWLSIQHWIRRRRHHGNKL